jgi:hypothetical protein
MVKDCCLRYEPIYAIEILVLFRHRCATKTPSDVLVRCALVCLDISEAPLSILHLFGGSALVLVLSACA